MNFIGLRLFHSFLMLLGVSALSFAFLQLAPGTFFDQMRLNPRISPETLNQFYKQYGIDKPLPVRYFRWLHSVVKGDCGVSLAYNSPVAPLVVARSENTLLLTGSAMLLSWMIALPMGILSAAMRQRRKWLDYACTFVTTLLLVTPDLLLALGFLWIALRTHWFPAGMMGSPGLANQSKWMHARDLSMHIVAPLLVLVLASLPLLVRHVRAAMIDALELPCIRALHAHGIPPLRILWQALRVAAAPLISLFGLGLGSLLSASLLIEVVMNWPGLGPLLLEAILSRDLYVVVGAVMLSAIFLIVGMLVADIVLFFSDPRIRTEALA
jgi:peptide/nickel transport system permease protein